MRFLPIMRQSLPLTMMAFALSCACLNAAEAPKPEAARSEVAPAISTDRKVIARCGKGFLEEVGGHKVLHVEGTAYEMGFQHGSLLKKNVQEMVRYLLDVKSKDLQMEWNGIKFLSPKKLIAGIQATQKKFIPQWYSDELRGLADGSGVPLEDVAACNFIPELFHCSGFALAGSATKNGEMYHGRVLDYGCDWRLQEHPILMVGKMNGKVPFLNVTYAGFIGSVTGMNAEKISLGEMGGRGLGGRLLECGHGLLRHPIADRS